MHRSALQQEENQPQADSEIPIAPKTRVTEPPALLPHESSSAKMSAATPGRRAMALRLVLIALGAGSAQVDDGWFKHALEGKCFGVPVRFCPPEETIWSKAFVMERERFDGADIAHLFLAAGERIDWQRLLQRFGPHWRVLFSHLVLFGFIFPSELSLIPNWVMHDLLSRLQNEMGNRIPGDKVCQGTLLSRTQYVEDIEARGYKDARLLASGGMTPNEVARWDAAAADNQALK